MNISNKEYDELNKKISPPSHMFRNMCFAFLIGGLICTIGQLLYRLYVYWGLGVSDARSVVSVTLIFIAGLLTGIGVFDKIAKYAGAGTIVPITGFANAIVSPAIEFKSEGWVMGLGAKLFALAGPVIVYGISSSVIYGVILWLFTL